MDADLPSWLRSPNAAQAAHGSLTDAEAVIRAKRLVAMHHALSRQLGDGFFDNPALLMLLELFIARIEHRTTTVKVLVLCSGVPSSTAQRWIDRLQAQKLVAKHVNKADRRSAHVTIADHAVIAIKALLGRLEAARPAPTEHRP